ncbi:MAG TPA: FKBP-type peptidyl-prolyl cis-trans isomerase [Micropepsaceae bacterium]|nr:FKBP-type peptidyl-prolyl cis-trans isomerase [Micropepsaceae bacterium]
MNRFQRLISDLTDEWKSLIRRKDRVAQSTAPASVQWPAWRVARDISPESNQQFLADNAKAPGVVVLPDGLQYRIIKKGDGKTPTPEDLVTVTYRGSLIDGTVFAGTMPGETATFPTGQLIGGWVEALLIMKEGGEWRLFVPANLGYGEEGNGQAVPPNQTLIFDIQLLTVGRPNVAAASHPEQTARVQ